MDIRQTRSALGESPAILELEFCFISPISPPTIGITLTYYDYNAISFI